MALIASEGGSDLSAQPGVTCMVTLRLPPKYAATLDDLAADLGQSKVSLVRRAVEHYVSNARPEADQSLVHQLLELGSVIRDQPHRSRRWRSAASPVS